MSGALAAFVLSASPDGNTVHRFCTAAVGALASLALAAAVEVYALRYPSAAPARSSYSTVHALSWAGLQPMLQSLAVAVALLTLARLLRGALALLWRAVTTPLPVRVTPNL